jgi:hypothetical protein
MSKKRVFKAFVLVAVASLLVPASGALAAECEADVSGSLMREEPDGDITRLVFKVDVSTTTACGEIHFNVILEIREDDGKIVKKKIPGLVKLHDGQTSEKTNHELSEGQSLVGWEVKLDRCEKC